MAIFEKLEDFPYLRWIEGFFIGALVVLLIAIMIPNKEPEVKYIKVPEVKVIEKPVVVKKPVYVSAHDRRQIQCLAENAYFEAGNQSKKGMIAVSNVVMNRAEDKRFPSTPCGVVHQRTSRVCQFSWVCEGKKKIRDWALYEKTKRVAENVYLGNYGDVTNGAKFYHATYVSPGWNMRRVKQIGAHIFYRG